MIRKAKYDLALGLSQLGSLFTRFCGTPYHYDFFDINYRAEQPVTQMSLDIVRSAGCVPGSFQTEFWMHPWEEAAALENVAKFLCSENYDGSPLIALHSGGHYFTRKRWPLDNYIRLAQYLLVQTGWRVVLIGGREDIENSRTIQKAVPQVINATGRFKLSETAVLLKYCRIYLGNDSGPLHLAAAMGTPTLGLFGPTAPRQFYPYSPPDHTYIAKKLPCSPCYKFGGGFWQQIPKCSRAYCMEAISPEEVLYQLLVIDEQLPNQSSMNGNRLRRLTMSGHQLTIGNGKDS